MRKPAKPQGPIMPPDHYQGIQVCGLLVNCSAIARSQGMTAQYVSMILNGVRETRIGNYIKIAACIGVTLDELVAGIEERKRLKTEYNLDMINLHNERLSREAIEDKKLKARGLPPKPRLPLAPRSKSHTS